MSPLIYHDRRDAGQRLVPLLTEFSEAEDTIVLGLPRGGVPVADEIAAALHLPLDVVVVRKLGFPGQPELAMGAIASGDITVINEMMDRVPNAEALLREAEVREHKELLRREALFRSKRPALDVAEKTVLVVDDGTATGANLRAAILSLRRRRVSRCVAVVPVASAEAFRNVESVADTIVCPLVPEDFRGVGQFYADFEQTTDEEVQDCLRRSSAVPELALH